MYAVVSAVRTSKAAAARAEFGERLVDGASRHARSLRRLIAVERPAGGDERHVGLRLIAGHADCLKLLDNPSLFHGRIVTGMLMR